MKLRNILMVATANAGTNYWRLYNWWNSFHRTDKARCAILGWDKTEDGMAQWQYEIAEANNQPRLFGMLYSGGAQADAIVWGRVHSAWALNTFYAMRDQFPGKPFLTEIDDDITDIAAYNPAAAQFRPGEPMLEVALEQFRNSDGLIVSTPYLKEIYSEYNDNIHVVPNSIDVPKWNGIRGRARPGIRIGWIGATSHLEDLMLLEDVIPQVVKRHRHVKFVFCTAKGGIPDSIKNLRGVACVEKWTPILKYPNHVASLDFDIGLAPLRDNRFNRAKSNLRWLEYGGFGVPCIASNVGHFAQTVRHGEDGLLVNSTKGWVDAICSLIENRELRNAIGNKAKARIERDFNVDKNSDLYIDAIEDVLSRPVKPAPPLVTGVDDMRLEAETDGGLEMSPLERIEEVPSIGGAI